MKTFDESQLDRLLLIHGIMSEVQRNAIINQITKDHVWVRRKDYALAEALIRAIENIIDNHKEYTS